MTERDKLEEILEMLRGLQDELEDTNHPIEETISEMVEDLEDFLND